ncbi:ThuA domain-containing protein [Rubripirellula amarantea]|nr:ThuA domain-containing protein [Rubripirellula amarantea]
MRIKNLGESSDHTEATGKKRVVFVAGKPSHGYGSHEHYAGCRLLANALRESMPDYQVEVIQNGWPENGIKAFEGADSVVVYCDGGGRHLLNPHVDEFNEVMNQGVGLVCIHYAVETPEGKTGNAFLDWIGGYFEANWSVNPHWVAEFNAFPDHPTTKGVKPFKINDEWYFHMRFRDQMKDVTPILSAHPPEETMRREDGPHSGNPTVRKAVANGEIQHVAWAAERDGGGRGFGFTGGHFHWNWADENFRKVVLNAIVWASHGDVPENGVTTENPTQEQLEENQDEPKPATAK